MLAICMGGFTGVQPMGMHLLQIGAGVVLSYSALIRRIVRVEYIRIFLVNTANLVS